MYLTKPRAGENVAFKDRVRWQEWTLAPLSRQVKVYYFRLKLKVKCSLEVVEIGSENSMLAKCFAMTEKYLPVICWKQYYQQNTWSPSEWGHDTKGRSSH